MTRFARGLGDFKQNPPLTAREMAMLQFMNRVTEEPDWNINLYDDEFLDRWHTESRKFVNELHLKLEENRWKIPGHHELDKFRRHLMMENSVLLEPLINQKTWDWCLNELRDKAIVFDSKKFIPVLDAGGCVCKSDILVESALQTELSSLIQTLFQSSEDGTTSTNGILHLVDPAMFPLIHGRSRVLHQGIECDLNNCLSLCGHAAATSVDLEQNPEIFRPFTVPDSDWQDLLEGYNPCGWSNKFQYLPAEVSFTNDDYSDDCTVQITSYINNLHPIRHAPLYNAIEKLISRCIEPWNHAIIEGSRPRWPIRIRTYGLREYQMHRPSWEDKCGRLMELTDEEYSDLFIKLKKYVELPEPESSRTVRLNRPRENWDREVSPWRDWREVVARKHRRLSFLRHPEPGVAFTYAEWKAGKNGNAVVERIDRYEYYDGDGSNNIPPAPDHEFYSVRLQDFRNQGLQVVVKISNIELTPEDSTFPGDKWHVEGLKSDKIVAVAHFVHDLKNIANPYLKFRQEAGVDEKEYHYNGMNEWSYLGDLYGTRIPDEDETSSVQDEAPSVQELDTISVNQGRLVVWPNTLQYQMEPFGLVNKNQPGYYRFITLLLVDPNERVYSTRNVPPQRHDWWKEEVFSIINLNERLPKEIIDMIEKDTYGWPISLEEAREIREDFLNEYNDTHLDLMVGPWAFLDDRVLRNYGEWPDWAFA